MRCAARSSPPVAHPPRGSRSANRRPRRTTAVHAPVSDRSDGSPRTDLATVPPQADDTRRGGRPTPTFQAQSGRLLRRPRSGHRRRCAGATTTAGAPHRRHRLQVHDRSSPERLPAPRPHPGAQRVDSDTVEPTTVSTTVAHPTGCPSTTATSQHHRRRPQMRRRHADRGGCNPSPPHGRARQ